MRRTTKRGPCVGGADVGRVHQRRQRWLVAAPLLALALALGTLPAHTPARADSNLTRDAAGDARADSIRAAKKLAKKLARLAKKRGAAAPSAAGPQVTEPLDSLASALQRSGQKPAPAGAKPHGKPKRAKMPPAPRGAGPAPETPLQAVVPAPALPAGRVVPLERRLSPLDEQTSDPVIERDLDALDGWQARLDSLPGAGQDVWRAASARAWLEAARVEYTDNDRQGFPQAAFERAVALISDLQAGKAPVDSSNAPVAQVPRGSVRLVDSLYARLDSLKHNPGFRCAREPLARLEVELAWAGNEKLDQGDCRTSPHVARAIELARAAEDSVALCIPPPVAVAPEAPLPAPAPDPVIAVPMPTREELRIPRNVHFALNQFDIGPTSRGVIGGIVALLQKYPSITVRLVGHADSRGSPEYNLALSKRRVEVVRAVLVEMGIDSTRLSTDYRGKSEPYAIEDSKRGFALNRRVEMVFVDAQGRDIKAEAQEGDLQLEQDRSPKSGTRPGTKRKPLAPEAKPVVKP